MRGHSLRWLAWAPALAAAACSSASGPGAAPCNPAPITVDTLAVGQWASVDVTGDQCEIGFPGNPSPTDTVEYVVTAQGVTGQADTRTGFLLKGADALAAAAPPAVAPPIAFGTPLRGPGALGARFDAWLRGVEAARHPELAPRPPAAAPPVAKVVPTVGDSVKFKVIAKLDGSQFDTVTAVARSVLGHIALFVDVNAPANGLTQAQLDSIAQLFDTQLYAVDTTAFGRESDIDNNGVVEVLMTPVVNQLVDATTCQTSGYVAGFFFGFDIDPSTRLDPRSNRAEIFYSMVADPTGTFSCAHSVSEVQSFVPAVFVHEFQHMISYNQHVLVRSAPPEVLWLNEGLSHFAEELGARSFLPGDSAEFRNFVIHDQYNLYHYLTAPGAHVVVADTSQLGSLEQRGAWWMFVRFLADRFGAGVTYALDHTALTGAANVAAQTGQPFGQTLAEWGLASWVSDLPGFTPPAELHYTSWDWRAMFADLHAADSKNFPTAFPLVPPAGAPSSVNVGATLYAGSPYYQRVLLTPGTGPFTLRLTQPDGSRLGTTLAPRLNVIRVR